MLSPGHGVERTTGKFLPQQTAASCSGSRPRSRPGWGAPHRAPLCRYSDSRVRFSQLTKNLFSPSNCSNDFMFSCRRPTTSSGGVMSIEAFPIRSLLSGNGSFGPEEVVLLVDAFENAISDMGVDRKAPAALVIAKRVVELAKQGERDPSRLCNGAIKTIQ